MEYTNLTLRNMSKQELLELKGRIENLLKADEECAECGHPNNNHSASCVAVE